jgi:hypothetical protein
MTRSVPCTLATILFVISMPSWAQQRSTKASVAERPHATKLVTIADTRSGVAQLINIGKPGDSPGDMFVFDRPLLNANREPIGTNSGSCIRYAARQVQSVSVDADAS